MRCAVVRRLRTAFLTDVGRRAGTHQKGRKLTDALEQNLKPLISSSLKVPNEFEQAQFTLLFFAIL